MSKYNVKNNGHEFEIFASLWTGKEQIKYDNRIMSTKRNYGSFSVHNFEVDENGEVANYEINIHSSIFGKFYYVIRRNGVVLSHNT